MVMVPRSVTTVVMPCEACDSAAVNVTLASSSVTSLVDRLTVTGVSVSAICAVADAVPMSRSSKLPPVALVMVFVRLSASR